MKPMTHLGLRPEWCGRAGELAPGAALVDLQATPDMACDERGLVHGGFIFGLADHAAMLAVNDPNVVLGSATVRFTRPVEVGDRLTAWAQVVAAQGRHHTVEVTVRREDEPVLVGTFECFVLDGHAFDQKKRQS